MKATFQLHAQLAADTLEVGKLGVSRVLLMNDARYPWLLLVPERENLVELIDLRPTDYATVCEEIRRACLAMRECYAPDKLNVAALGNVVPQLHIHIIARHRGDPAWPRPVWGGPPAPPYAPEQAVKRVNDLRAALRIV
jgi:diadenosine tetraphosphate (Ap4A) HIT family hydrolase